MLKKSPEVLRKTKSPERKVRTASPLRSWEKSGDSDEPDADFEDSPEDINGSDDASDHKKRKAQDDTNVYSQPY